MTLIASDRPPAQTYDVALLDLDGVVYVGHDAVPGAPAALGLAREAGMRLAFVTNNAARTPAEVAAHLTNLGVGAQPEDVITSAQAAAHYLADRLAPGSRVLVVGTVGLEVALRERGLTPVKSAEDLPAAVVQGYSADLSWRQLAEGAVAIMRDLPWIATNLDPTVPSPRGLLPGNGSMVAALRHATGRVPVATGKPDPTMHRESVERSHALRPIVVGDRLDTDIEGATAVGCPSLLVLTGVTGWRDLLVAGPDHRPNLIAEDLAGLLAVHPPVLQYGAGFTCRRWLATATRGALEVQLMNDVAVPENVRQSGDDLDVLRALCGAAWHSGTRISDEDRLVVRPTDEASEQAVARLGM